MIASLRFLTTQLEGHLRPPKTDSDKLNFAQQLEHAAKDVLRLAEGNSATSLFPGLAASAGDTPPGSRSASRTRAEASNVRDHNILFFVSLTSF